jgi:cystathionine beta-lyase
MTDKSFDFDEVIDRTNTNSIKYEFAKERGMPEGLLPMWVADMDFKTPPTVIDKLIEVSKHGIFGYTEVKEDYFQALSGWFSRRFNYNVHKSWVRKTPGVVFALAMCIRAYTKPGDSVIIQTPVYYPFSGCILENGRKLVDNPLRYHQGRYTMDFDDLEKKMVSENAHLLLLCSPHNPVSRVWTRQELSELGRICLKHDCLVISDEIHCDFIFGGRAHHIFSTVQSAFEEISVILTAPSKTFNIAGLHIANAFISNSNLRTLLKQEMSRTGTSQLNAMGLAACQAAYETGEQWLESLLAYLEGNIALTKEFILQRLPQLHLIEPEGTYLLWLDCRKLGDDQEINDIIIKKARLWLDSGTMFGKTGSGFQRINIACPKSVLLEALERLDKAVN